MKSLIGGVALAAAGAIITFLGLAMVLGWRGGNLYQAIPVTALGAVLIGLGGYVQKPNTPRSFLLTGAACLVTAFLLATQASQMINGGTNPDALQLWCLMAAGTMLFFGLAAMIAAAFSYLMTKG